MKQDINDLEAYDKHFVKGDISDLFPNRRKAFETGKIILKEIYDRFNFKSVIDFGCGSGAYLAAAQIFNS